MDFCPPGQGTGLLTLGLGISSVRNWRGCVPALKPLHSACHLPPVAERGDVPGSLPGCHPASVPGCPLSQHPFLLPTLILKLPDVGLFHCIQLSLRGDDTCFCLLFYWFMYFAKL